MHPSTFLTTFIGVVVPGLYIPMTCVVPITTESQVVRFQDYTRSRGFATCCVPCYPAAVHVLECMHQISGNIMTLQLSVKTNDCLRNNFYASFVSIAFQSSRDPISLQPLQHCTPYQTLTTQLAQHYPHSIAACVRCADLECWFLVSGELKPTSRSCIYSATVFTE